MITPELYCENLIVSRAFYTRVIGMEVKYERIEEKFIFLCLERINIMIEQLDSTSRKWITAPLEMPFGRGINLQCEVLDLKSIYERAMMYSPQSIYLKLESKSYDCDGILVTQEQFILQDPDGYLLRFCKLIP